MKRLTSQACFILLVVFAISCGKSQVNSGFDPDGKSGLTIMNRSGENIHVSVSNWIYITSSEERIDTTVAAGQSLDLSLTTQACQYYILRIDSAEFRLFAMPGRDNSVVVEGKGQLRYDGELSAINEFLKARSTDSDWRPRGTWHQGRGSVNDLLIAYDSITEHQKRQLLAHEALPSWYRDFEQARLDYVNAGQKMNALIYRKKLLSINDSVPPGILDQITGGLTVERTDFLGVLDYMRFLSDYSYLKRDSFLVDPIPSTNDEWFSSDRKNIESIERSFEKRETKEILLTQYFISTIARARFRWNDEFLGLIHDPKLRAMIEDQLLSRQILPAGTKLPYFYLPDLDSVFYEPGSFAGKVVLINFWATWCRPCYQEFEHENQLVGKFKGKPVVIVNVCIESKMEKWKDVVNRYELKTLNLFAEGNWSEKINRDFGTSALPHSILVDHEGKVIQNKCPGASQGVGKLIEDALARLHK